MFFCKRGKQKHNRAGFYWGVPSETAGGYDWTKKFRRNTICGERAKPVRR